MEQELQNAVDVVSKLIDEDALDQLYDPELVASVREMIKEVYKEEVVKINLEDVEDSDESDVIQRFVENLALKIALVCLLGNNDEETTTPELRISADDLTSLITNILKAGTSKLTITTD